MSSTKEWMDLDPPLTSWVGEAVTSFGFSQMTPVQAAVIPLFRGNKDVVVEAVTGSGKTMAFLIPIIERILTLTTELKSGQTNSIIISPTRELAEQISRVLNSILDFAPTKKTIRTQLIVGGGDPTHVDLKKFLAKRPHVLVATPGRLLELLNQSQVTMKALEVLTLDEADQLLDLGFETTLSKILSLLPKQKRVGLFSATISDALSEIVRVGLRNPVKIVVSSGSKQQARTPRSLGINYMVVEPRYKLPVLLDTVQNMDFKKIIVYFPSCNSVTYFHSIVSLLLGSKSDVKVFGLHGKLQPGPRHKTLVNFTECPGKAVLFATDVAARGLDIPEVDHVLQLNPPKDPTMFLHRAGRAGRAGRDGTCTVLLHPGREESYVDFMQVRKVKMVPLEPPEISAASIDEMEAKIRKWMLEDRARHDTAIKSFTAFARFYTEHTATSIFRSSDLDWKELGRSYYLIRLPRMPELKGIKDDETYIGERVDMDNYAYVDPQREATRKENLQKAAQTSAEKKAQHEKNKAWSIKVEKKEVRQDRKEKRKAKNLAKVKEIIDNANSSDEEEQEDWKNLVRQNKRQKKNNVSEVASFDDL